MKIGTKEFCDDHTYVMGILNVTPDSFSDGGKFDQKDEALYHVEQMIADGADIIDVGGESTRPGYTLISDEEELSRVIPVIEEIKKRFDIPISLDTYKSAVAAGGIAAGVDLINDVWGLQYDDAMGDVVATSGVSYCLMHNRKETDETWDLSDFLRHYKEDMDRAKHYGIKEENIIYDPGIGFAKTQEQNLLLIGNLDAYTKEGIPVLLGTSRKSVINYVLDVPVDKRLAGTLATTAEAVYAGARFVRVHDVKENVEFIKMLEATRAAKVR